MRKPIVLVTVAALLSMLGCDRRTSATTPPPVGREVLSTKHHGDSGFEMDVVVTRGCGGVVSEASAKDPTTGDDAEIWTDGRTIMWTGTIGGEQVSGSSVASDLLDLEDSASPTCPSPVAPLICLGATAALLAGCAFGFSCEGSP